MQSREDVENQLIALRAELAREVARVKAEQAVVQAEIKQRDAMSCFEEMGETLSILDEGMRKFFTTPEGSKEQKEEGEKLCNIVHAGDQAVKLLPLQSRLRQLWHQLRSTVVTILIGAGLGAAIGSVIPGPGTVVGAAIGAGIAAMGIFGGKIGDKIGSDYAEKKWKSDAEARKTNSILKAEQAELQKALESRNAPKK
ncbi:MAG: hypothetical protein K0S27_545 [Gammaproteobacteria bacterium]|jgi:hypothetical protein|nr:hypothetical protein [Gammaproteobacteria bacterium]